LVIGVDLALGLNVAVTLLECAEQLNSFGFTIKRNGCGCSYHPLETIQEQQQAPVLD
jgi:hypothetical protein